MSTATTPRLVDVYNKQIIPKLKAEFQYTNLLDVPKLKKIVINIGCGQAAHDAKLLAAAQKTLETISGQKPSVTRAKKSISNFKLREGDPVGCKVTLRRAYMYEFFDRLVNIVLPRIRDFRGLSLKGFDGSGNYTFGVDEQLIFPEIMMDPVPYTLGMNISLITSADTDEEAKALLYNLGFPLVKPQVSQA